MNLQQQITEIEQSRKQLKTKKGMGPIQKQMLERLKTIDEWYQTTGHTYFTNELAQHQENIHNDAVLKYLKNDFDHTINLLILIDLETRGKLIIEAFECPDKVTTITDRYTMHFDFDWIENHALKIVKTKPDLYSHPKDLAVVTTDIMFNYTKAQHQQTIQATTFLTNRKETFAFEHVISK